MLVRTVGALIRALQEHPLDAPLSVTGPDSGGYDCECGQSLLSITSLDGYVILCGDHGDKKFPDTRPEGNFGIEVL